MTITADRFVPLAVIRQAHGVRGEVKVTSLSTPPEAFLAHALHDASGTAFRLTRTGTQPDLFICRIEGITDRTPAEALKGTKLGVMRSVLGDMDDGTVFADELIGVTVINEQGQPIGTIHDIVNYGASDIAVIATDSGEIMLPYAAQFFPHEVTDGTLLCLIPETVSGKEP